MKNKFILDVSYISTICKYSKRNYLNMFTTLLIIFFVIECFLCDSLFVEETLSIIIPSNKFNESMLKKTNELIKQIK